MGKAALLAITLVVSALAQPVKAATDDLIASEMVDQAREWQQKDRDDLAAEIWRKLLRANPKHPEALIKLGVIEARSGHRSEAKTLYNQASRLTPPPIGLKQLSAALEVVQESSADGADSLPKVEPALANPVESAEKTLPRKPVAPKTVSPSLVTPKAKAQTPASGTVSNEVVNKKPAHDAKVDALNLKFSNSIGSAR